MEEGEDRETEGGGDEGDERVRAVLVEGVAEVILPGVAEEWTAIHADG